MQESWLDDSVPSFVLPNFVKILRRDRSKGPNRGGIITYARSDVNNIVEFKVSVGSERCWHIVQRDTGSLGICNCFVSRLCLSFALYFLFPSSVLLLGPRLLWC